MGKKRKNEDSAVGDDIFALIFGGGFVIGIMYIGGWSLAWGERIYSKKSLIIGDAGLLLRINDAYYGLAMSDRFFDAPLIQWLCLIPLFASLGVFGFIFGDGD